jgi:hypothetical protein
MEVKFWVGPSVTKSNMSATSMAARSATHFLLGDCEGEVCALAQGESLFIVGGRKSITKALIYDIKHLNIRTAGGHAAITVKKSQKFIGKNKRIVQIHGVNDGPGNTANVTFDGNFVSMTRIRDCLENNVWGPQYV